MRALAIATMLLLSACATPNKDWFKPGSTERDLALDQSICNREWLTTLINPLSTGVFIYERRCLKEKGWTIRE